MLSSMPSVYIVLLNYNGSKDTIECLQSIQKITYPNYRVVIIDNDSPDNSMQEIESFLQSKEINYAKYMSPNEAMSDVNGLSQHILLQAGENGGYGHGNNIGIKFAIKNDTDYVLILNNDTIVDPGFLEPLVLMCKRDKTIGIASGKIYFYDRPDVIWFNGGIFHPWIAKVEHVNFNEKDLGQKTLSDSTFVTGCMWLIPNKVIKKVGFINEEYFMYIEDLEFTQRIQQAGYKLKVSGESYIWHKVGSSTGGRFSDFSVYWRTKNMIKFLMKQPQNPLVIMNSLIIYNIKLFIKLIIEKKLKLVSVQAKAIFHALSSK